MIPSTAIAVVMVCAGWLGGESGLLEATTEEPDAGKTDSRPATPANTTANRAGGHELSSEQRAKLKERNSLIRGVKSLRAEGKVPEAVEMLGQLIAIEREALGEASTDVAESYGWLAQIQEDADDFDAAEKSRQSALEILTKIHGKEDYRVIDARWLLQTTRLKGQLDAAGRRELATADELNRLARQHYQRGEYAKAVSCIAESLKIRQKALGEEHPGYATSLNNFALLYKLMGDYARAEPLFQKALAIQKKALGEEHPAYAASLDNLAGLYQSMGDSVRAEPLVQQALAIRKKVLGEEHPDYAASLNNLASMYRSISDYARAEPLYKEVLAITKKALGEEHPHYATSLNNLAVLYHSMGDFTRAEPLYKQALAITKKNLGEEHPEYATSLSNLASLYQDMGDYARAELLCQQALAIKKKALGEEHRDYALSLNNLASLYQDMGDYARAEPLFQKALMIAKKALGEEHRDYAASLNNLAGLYHSMGDSGRAEPLFQQALAITKKILGEEHPDYATSLSSSAMLYRDLGDYARAEPLYEQVLAIRKKVQGEEHPDYASDLNNLASLYQDMSDYARAEALYRRALAIRKKVLGEKHPDYANSLNNLAFLYKSIGDYARAEPLYQQALAITKKVLGEQHPHYATTLNNLAFLYQTMGDSVRAEPFAREALDATLRHLEQVLPALSEAQALAMLDNTRGVDFWLTIAHDLPQTHPLPAWSRAWRSRGLIGATMRQRRLAVLATPEAAPLVAELRTTQQQLAQLTLAVPRPEQSEVRQKRLTELNDAKESLEKRLAAVSAEFRKGKQLDAAGPQELLGRLPPGTVVVDLARVVYYRRVTEAGQPARIRPEWHYEAFVAHGRKTSEDAEARGAGRQHGPAVAWVHLGPAQPIDEAVSAWRAAIVQRDAPSADEDAPEVILRQLVWAPLEERFGGNETVIVIPDGPLAVLPWSALPGRRPGSHVLDEYQVTMASHGRQLIQLLEEVPAYQAQLLVAGGVDYDHRPTEALPAVGGEKPSPTLAATAERSRTPPLDRAKQGHWKFLPGTKAEAKQVAGLWNVAGGVTRLSDVGASESAFRAAAPRARFLHLATHGFFADPVYRSMFEDVSSGERLLSGKSAAKRPNVTARNPLVLTGVVLAGANLPPVTDELGLPTGEDGIFTAEEVVNLDLRGSELVVLSACETGLGEIGGGGEGMFGLQRAFHLAGSRNVVGSLWQVNDAATMALMTEFYKNLWERKLSPAAALRRAQLLMLAAYDPEGGRLRAGSAQDELDETGLTRARARQLGNPKNAVLPPYYWSAFSFSGDWR